MTKRIKAMLRGIGSVVDVLPNSGDRLKRVRSYKSDADALRHDWEKVGRDMRQAIHQYEVHDGTAKQH